MDVEIQLRRSVTLCLVLAGIIYNLSQASAMPQAQRAPGVAANDTAAQMDDSRTTDAAVEPLIAADDLRKLIEADTAGLKILEPAKSAAEFSKGHLPGARFVHWVDDMTDSANAGRYNNPQTAKFTAVMSKLGIGNEDRIVIYDRLNNRLSTRLFWTLKYFGHRRVQILDGGFEVWKSKSFLLSTETVKIVPSQYRVSSVEKSLLAEMDFVETRLQDPNTRLIDGRPRPQYSGALPGRVFHTNQPHARKGHIPRAVNVFWKDNFQADGRFKPVKDLKELYAQADIKPNHGVITYCNEGLHAAPPWFVLSQLLDYEDVRLYDSSMAEWAKSENPLQSVADGDAAATAGSDPKSDSGSDPTSDN